MLLTGLGLLPRLGLGLRERLSVLYLPFLRGLRLAERGEMERRRSGDCDSGLGLEASEYGDRVRGLPRGGDGDLDGMIVVALVLLEWNGARRVASLNARLAIF